MVPSSGCGSGERTASLFYSYLIVGIVELAGLGNVVEGKPVGSQVVNLLDRSRCLCYLNNKHNLKKNQRFILPNINLIPLYNIFIYYI